MIELKKEDVFQTFFAAGLEGDYNFLEDDLMKLANAFVAMAAPAIVKEERAECVKFAKSLNHLVGEALQVKRNSL
jgi:hypothetical protein